MRESEKEQKKLRAWRLKICTKVKAVLYTVLSGAFMAKPPLQITKITRRITITGGQIGKKIKSDKKSQKGKSSMNSVTG